MMRDRDWHELRVIESGLRAEAPELAALLDPRAQPARGLGYRDLLPAGLLLIGLFIGDPTAALGGLALLGMWVVPWTVYPEGRVTGRVGRRAQRR